MSGLDRLVWADGVAFRVFGVRIGVRVSQHDWLPSLFERVPGPYRASRSGVVDRVFSVRAGMLWSDHSQIARAQSRPPIADAFGAAVRGLLVKEARRYLFVYASAVGWRGRAIVIPGPGRAATPDLVQALVERGATCYSNDFAVFDRRGRVHAFMPAHHGTMRPPLPLGLVVLTRPTSGLLQNVAKADVAPAVVARLAERAAGIEMSCEDTRESADRILAHLAGNG